jgi:single-stranded-DNA-specific exonuclease
VLRQVFSRRNLSSLADLDLDLGSLTPVGRFGQLEAAVDLLVKHRGNRIIIVGDFDSDGATSAAVMLLTLRDLGFADVGFFVPDRFELGYGLTTGAVARVTERAPALIVTVDNGISSVEGVAAARAGGIDVLITDHHLPPDVLPQASAIVNPSIPDCDFPGRNLAGVGVVFYLLAALGRAMGRPGAVAAYLDLVALGTVADLVPLDRLNRILVSQGLRRMRAGRCRPGIRALCQVAGVELAHATTSTLGFVIAPRLNAAGRLADMTVGVQCLISQDDAHAQILARRLDELNRERRELESRMRADAMDLVDSLEHEHGAAERRVLCLHRTDWHEGLVGLVASRVRERVYRPVFAFAESGSGMLKGSGRSIPGFHLRDALADVAARSPGLIERFGGHAMAAGLSLRAEVLDEFTSAIESVAAQRLNDESLSDCVWTDGALAPAHLDLATARLLRDAAPWGQAFPEPAFDGIFDVLDHSWSKEIHLKMKLRSVDGESVVDGIAFNSRSTDVKNGDRFRIVYRLGVNDYYSPETLQLRVEHIETEAE